MLARDPEHGVTLYVRRLFRRLADAVRAGDLEAVRSMVALRPELVNLDLAEDDEHQALHRAVLQRQPEIVRFLMRHGADPRKGIYPHRAESLFPHL